MVNTTENFDLENIKTNLSSLTIKESLDIVSSNENGLSEAEAKYRLSQYGENKLPEKEKKSKLNIFLSNFKSPLVYALLAASVFAFIIGKYVDVVVILIVVIVNAIIGYIQEIKAEKDIEALKKLSNFFVKVIREGNILETDTQKLVPGDIVLLEEGNRVPADGRLIKAENLLINESSLTGESELIYKTDEKVKEKPQETPRNMVFQGTTATEGIGHFVVLSTGPDTKFGKIALFAQETESETPIQKKIEKLSKQIGIAVLIVSAFVFGIGVMGGRNAMEMIQLAVSLAVSAIPEGLPIAVTIILVLGAKRMAKRKAIVRNMMAVETLGTTTVIATDKTGTLTHNKLKVTDIFTTKDYAFEQDQKSEKGVFINKNKKYFDKGIKQLLLAGAICNNAEFDHKNIEVIGEPTDAAILENAMMLGIKKHLYPILNELPFSSKRRLMAVLSKTDEGKFVFLKGAPEEILAKCSFYYKEGGHKSKINRDEIKTLTAQTEKMSRRGLRVVAVAEKPFLKNFDSSLKNDFIFLGFIGMKDTYRPGVKESIEKCKRAGIKIIMLTGDHLETAAAIAKKLNIIKDKKEAVLAQNYLFEEKGTNTINNISVFARILPEIKYKIIDYFKRNDEIVAMTGDGVNDVPALRKADIGIAMGNSGTDAAKEAADLILADDNFSTIVAAVEEGRTIFANLRKTLLYLISTSLGEVITVIGSLLLALPLPITPLQILWINLITDTSATIPLGVEPKEDDHLKVPPRNPKEGIISFLMIRRSFLVGLYMAIVALIIFQNNLSFGIDYARTTTFLFLSISQWFNAFNCRSEKKSVLVMNIFSNKSLLLGIFLGFLAQLAVMYVVFLEKIFGFVPVGIDEWLVAVIFSFGLIILIEIDKLISKAFAKASQGLAT